ncbi:hypothetical protein [Saccharibacillus sp. JS10]|uniref:hypothetical protein n=1 Tax=Saccharibacillus sp. JS10 TaxID=2950552 RepID=UPI00210A7AE0|nr:hypothetical protein [Saccharibacillus sp. JS10]MCQ4087533.1 hypothetical protein [Saccharibacillus sp. JS10]
MKILFKSIAILGFLTLIGMILGFTANFQKQIDLVDTVRLFAIGIPLLLLSIFSLHLGFSNKASIHNWVKILVALLSVVMLGVTLHTLFRIPQEGWLKESVTADTYYLSTTDELPFPIEYFEIDIAHN